MVTHIQHALAVARGDATRIAHFTLRRERFLDALDGAMLSEDYGRQSAMLDDLLEGDLADAILYIDWLVERLADGAEALPGVLRFAPHPRPWHAEWITLVS
jgi:hypothetical protein